MLSVCASPPRRSAAAVACGVESVRSVTAGSGECRAPAPSERSRAPPWELVAPRTRRHRPFHTKAQRAEHPRVCTIGYSEDRDMQVMQRIVNRASQSHAREWSGGQKGERYPESAEPSSQLPLHPLSGRRNCERPAVTLGRKEPPGRLCRSSRRRLVRAGLGKRFSRRGHCVVGAPLACDGRGCPWPPFVRSWATMC